ncbi:hypothetical protein MM239_14770 [Belliella sp. DSM 111904]|uniref:Uncharacterized protein n=1 Tax=Belliella filtrata TaxID=2923435 RepID=A0ABS9V2R3_9BACT|nr:hypothetical protein [Belliella filtrata]MCH7410668.1 hypothetical protein [Belliella filtrata]
MINQRFGTLGKSTGAPSVVCCCPCRRLLGSVHIKWAPTEGHLPLENGAGWAVLPNSHKP